jgi:autotransporter-associated beta strand protein
MFHARRSSWRQDHHGRKTLAAFIILTFVTLLAPAAADAAIYRWKNDADGQWNIAANWTVINGPDGLGYPSLPGDMAIIDGDFSATRTVEIPDNLAITIGELVISGDQNVRITSGGPASRLRFDNGANPSIFMLNLASAHEIDVWIQLDSDLDVRHHGAGGSVVFKRVIQETSGVRSFKKDGFGTVEFASAMAYSGVTTVWGGELRLGTPPTEQSRIPGDLVIGDGNGAPGEALVSGANGAIVAGADVQIFRDGTLSVTRTDTDPAASNQLGNVTIETGSITLTGVNTTMRAQTLTMNGGRIALSGTPQAMFEVVGPMTATSDSIGPATIDTHSGFAGTLRLIADPVTVNVADGQHDIDLRVDVPISHGIPASLRKTGPGTMLAAFSQVLETTVAEGTLRLLGTPSYSEVTLEDGRLEAAGSIGPFQTTNGTLAIGTGTDLATLQAASITLGADTVVEMDIHGTAPGAYDQLRAPGGIELGGATLNLTVGTTLPYASTITLVDATGSSTIAGTFAGLPEGATIAAGGQTFKISYQTGDVVLRNITPRSYFLSEGATGAFFDEDVLIANPNLLPAPITMTFLLSDGGTFVKQQIVPAQSRVTVHVDEIPELADVSVSVRVTSDEGLPLGVERTMFWDSTRYGGHTANAVTEPRTEWYFAEGAQGFFDTWLLLANANNATTSATITFMRENEPPFELTVPVLEPSSRVTLYAGDYPELRDRSFGMKVTSPLPISTERAMYFTPDPQRFWTGGHANVGSVAPSTSWFHAEGATGTYFTTFILISNPQTSPAHVTLQFLLPTGETVSVERDIQAQERITINPADLGDPRLQNTALSTVVTSNQPVVSERAMYWPEYIPPGRFTPPVTIPLGEGHVSSGVTSTASTWDLAEGRSDGDYGYTTYILLANPSAVAANVEVTFLPEGPGGPIVKNYLVPPTSRYNIDVGNEVPELNDKSYGARVRVLNDVGIAVERSLYWSTNGIFWAGGTNALGIPVP